jgi:deoxyribodipyrimidine photolyase-related protein
MLDADKTVDAISRAARYPLTREVALGRLNTFFKEMLPKFGPYEDAFRHENVPYGYHSVLSSSLNNGLLTPDDVIGKIREYSRKLPGKFLASLEGFTRQVIGWRSYTRMVYREERDTMVKRNYLGHSKRLGKDWFRGESPPTTGIDWLDTLFRDATERAYAHHIVRLMVFSQWFLLMRIRPLDVLDWFWSVVSIDAYEWVMVPNVLGMGQFADGGMMMRRPYVSASAYLKRMSGNTLPKSHKTDDTVGWDTKWDALYYSFLMDHEARLEKIYAYSRSYAYMRKAPKEKQDEWKEISRKILN